MMRRAMITPVTSRSWRRLPMKYMSTQTNRNATSSDDVKPFSEVPRPKALPIIGTFLNQYRGGATSGKLHTYFSNRSKELGPIFRENLGPVPAVWINDPETVREFFRKEPPQPMRFQFEAFRMHREQSGRGYGLFILDDEDWQIHRTALNRHMMRPRNVATHLEDFKHVTNDFLDIIERGFSGGKPIDKLRERLFYWSLEAGLSVVFEKRVGCLSETRDPDIDRFIQALQDVFDTSEGLLVIPPRLAKTLRLPVWNKHYQGWEVCFEVAEKFVNPLIEDAKAKLDRGEDAVGVVASMVKAGNISDKEILASIMTLMGAAVDTTSNTANWTLLLLSQNPEKQEKLRKEIESVVPSAEELSMQHINQLHYLKSTIRESLRLRPVAPIFSRLLKEDMVIDGYNIPKGTVIILNFIANRDNPDIYKEPGEFRPERWLRGDEGDDVNPHANLPFGHGVRMCIGRRVAELELQTLISTLLLKKRVELVDPNVIVGERTRLLMVPDTDPEMRFIDL